MLENNCHADVVKERYRPRLFIIASVFFVDHGTRMSCDRGPCGSNGMRVPNDSHSEPTKKRGLAELARNWIQTDQTAFTVENPASDYM